MSKILCFIFLASVSVSSFANVEIPLATYMSHVTVNTPYTNSVVEFVKTQNGSYIPAVTLISDNGSSPDGSPDIDEVSAYFKVTEGAIVREGGTLFYVLNGTKYVIGNKIFMSSRFRLARNVLSHHQVLPASNGDQGTYEVTLSLEIAE